MTPSSPRRPLHHAGWLFFRATTGLTDPLPSAAGRLGIPPDARGPCLRLAQPRQRLRMSGISPPRSPCRPAASAGRSTAPSGRAWSPVWTAPPTVARSTPPHRRRPGSGADPSCRRHLQLLEEVPCPTRRPPAALTSSVSCGARDHVNPEAVAPARSDESRRSSRPNPFPSRNGRWLRFGGTRGRGQARSAVPRATAVREAGEVGEPEAGGRRRRRRRSGPPRRRGADRALAHEVVDEAEVLDQPARLGVDPIPVVGRHVGEHRHAPPEAVADLHRSADVHARAAERRGWRSRGRRRRGRRRAKSARPSSSGRRPSRGREGTRRRARARRRWPLGLAEREGIGQEDSTAR